VSTSPPTLLVVDDEAQIRKFLRVSLTAHGYAVSEARTGAEALAEAAREPPPALMILDLGLPDIDGQEVLTRLRGWSDMPVLVLSVRAGEGEKVSALDHGADDYVTKPFGVAELLARVRVLLRKRRAGEAPAAVYSGDGLVVDLARRLVTVDGARRHLTPKEFDLLRVLVRQPGQLLTHQQLLREVWGESYTEQTHYLRVVIGHLRQKLGDDSTRPRFIVTEQGVGYRFRSS
jgi:two-component system KDP operon response regulator KdpE